MPGPYSWYWGVVSRRARFGGHEEKTYLGLSVAVRPELGRLSQQATTEPGAVPLPLVRDNLDFEAATLGAAAAYLAGANPRVH